MATSRRSSKLMILDFGCSGIRGRRYGLSDALWQEEHPSSVCRYAELRVATAPDVCDQVVRLTGRVKVDGLLGGQEAPGAPTSGCEGWI